MFGCGAWDTLTLYLYSVSYTSIRMDWTPERLTSAAFAALRERFLSESDPAK